MSAKKVLVVDDEASIREMLKLALEISDFECLEAADIREAYQLITDESPGRFVGDQLIRLADIRRLKTLKIRNLQRQLEHLADACLIIDHQHFFR